MKPIRNIFLVVIIIALFSCNNAESKKNVSVVSISNTSLDRVEPTNWWVNFKDTSLQLLVKENNIGNSKPSISYAGVSIVKVNTARSKNYLFIDLNIDKTTKPGKFDITFNFDDGTKKTHTYELKSREKQADNYVGFNSTDAIYLITPDRFSNADENNDINKKLKETTIDRKDGYKRHGGDLQGIINHIDYISDLGFTTVWPTPILTNNMYNGSYHGYAITDYYQVDPRFGTMTDYKNLADKLHQKGMKLIMDQVANHCGLEHWWMKDLPFKDWVNHQKNYEENIDNWNYKTNINSNHRRTTNQDLYASEVDRKGNNEGWFVSSMPDLNQRNPFMAKYIIQNSIWWIETLGLSGIRQDTYPYPDKDFMANWAGSIMNEYPNFSIVGEEWSYNPLLVGYWQKGAKNKDGYASNLKSTMDFPMQKAIIEGINEEESWDKGLVKLYEGLANDFHYATPKDIMVFLDNHDENRMFTALNEDVTKAKMALSYLLMLPRIPQIYYGTEILMDDTANPGDHGLIRTDFPGGFKDDKINAFTQKGLSDNQKSMQNFISKVLNYRKNSDAIHDGKTIHFAPFMGTYFLFRSVEDETVVHIINKNDKPITIDLKRYKEVGLKAKKLKNIITDQDFIWEDKINLKEKGSIILTTKSIF
ncbi:MULTISPECIES: glycoside hydrolase family 13 protein [Tenacibaculum]|uniref:glycoside hydrolase family 13 protein n=1 Tax=Tenacibaculum TaxID=104267 RepID=UPI001F0AB20C|nr:MULTISPECIES: glycoside hydrolase family 13 protein [Tenacibaculum]MCH3882000.1 glycoside hydrolase family 13 protein [Tenacibaculum aquimarinum]MDO6600753.1 glycoside hydrolase family 13 protein [Tenacibaculum sp. 1_MG-2023]